MFRTVLNVDIDALIAMIIAKDEKELDYQILNS
jgi:Na+/H+-dicarboxylate symporter